MPATLNVTRLLAASTPLPTTHPAPPQVPTASPGSTTSPTPGGATTLTTLSPRVDDDTELAAEITAEPTPTPVTTPPSTDATLAFEVDHTTLLLTSTPAFTATLNGVDSPTTSSVSVGVTTTLVTRPAALPEEPLAHETNNNSTARNENHGNQRTPDLAECISIGLMLPRNNPKDQHYGFKVVA
jgi:hypothetical protein